MTAVDAPTLLAEVEQRIAVLAAPTGQHPVQVVHVDDVAQKRYQDVNERYRKEIEAVWGRAPGRFGW